MFLWPRHAHTFHVRFGQTQAGPGGRIIEGKERGEGIKTTNSVHRWEKIRELGRLISCTRRWARSIRGRSRSICTGNTLCLLKNSNCTRMLSVGVWRRCVCTSRIALGKKKKRSPMNFTWLHARAREPTVLPRAVRDRHTKTRFIYNLGTTFPPSLFTRVFSSRYPAPIPRTKYL